MSGLWRHLPGSSRMLGPPRRIAGALAGYVAERRAGDPADASYTEIYPAHRLRRSLPGTLEPKIHAEFYRERHRLAFAAGVGLLPGGRVLTASGAVIGPGDHFIADVSHTSLTGNPAAHPIFLSPRLPKLERVAGTVAVIATYFSGIYYHWMIDALPRLHLLEKAGIAYDGIVAPTDQRFHREALALLGIGDERIIPALPNRHIEPEILVVPTLPGLIGNPQAWACHYLRSRFLPLVAGSHAARRVFISRGKAKTRCFINEEQVWAVLAEHGFEQAVLEDLPLLEQVALFQDAQIVVGAHGSGLTNLVFCKPGTAVVEIFSPNYMNVMYWALANQLGLDYQYLRGKSAHASSAKRGRRVHEDIFVDVAQLRMMLSQLLPAKKSAAVRA